MINSQMKCKWWFSYIPRHVTKKSCRITWVVHHSCTLKCPQVQMAVNKRYIHCWHLFYPFSLSPSLSRSCVPLLLICMEFLLLAIHSAEIFTFTRLNTNHHHPVSTNFLYFMYMRSCLYAVAFFLSPSQFSKPKWTSFYHNFWFNLSRTVLSCYVSVWISNIHATYAA